MLLLSKGRLIRFSQKIEYFPASTPATSIAPLLAVRQSTSATTVSGGAIRNQQEGSD
jgi:hypothetical protein